MPNRTLSWYDAVATLYDLGTLGDWFYRAARREAVDRLQLAAGEGVVDLFCGTGVDVPLLREAVGARGTVVGVDGSENMLRCAQRRAERNDARLMHADFSTDAGVRRLTEAMRRHEATAYLFTLGLTCLPGWRAFFRAVYDAALPGARFAIMDGYAERLTLGARFLNWIGAADVRRPVWDELEKRSTDFRKTTRRPLRVFDTDVLDASVVVASGRKPHRWQRATFDAPHATQHNMGSQSSTEN